MNTYIAQARNFQTGFLSDRKTIEASNPKAAIKAEWGGTPFFMAERGPIMLYSSADLQMKYVIVKNQRSLKCNVQNVNKLSMYQAHYFAHFAPLIWI